MSDMKLVAISHKIEPAALLEIAKEEDLESVMVLGFRKDGAMFFDRVELDNPKLLFAMEIAKQVVIDEAMAPSCPGCENCQP